MDLWNSGPSTWEGHWLPVDSLEGPTTQPAGRAIEPGFVDMIIEIRSRLGLSISLLAETMLVSRPTIYTWLRGDSNPHAGNRGRARALWQLAIAWPAGTPARLSEHIDSVVTSDGHTLRDLLTEESLRRFVIETALKDVASAMAPEEGVGRRIARRRGLQPESAADDYVDFLTGRRLSPE